MDGEVLLAGLERDALRNRPRRKRAVPFQPYFETGFPYGKDQFISAAATGWATMALTLAVEPPGRSQQTIAAGRREP